MSKKRSLRCLVVAMLVGTVFVIAPAVLCQVPNPDTLVVASSIDLTTLDPAVSTSNNDYKIIYSLYDRLVTYRGGVEGVVPMLAKRWDVSSDGLEWTLSLRDGVEFHDGTPVDAEAVKFSFERLLELGEYAAGLFSGILEPSGITVVDKHTVKFTLNAPFGPFLELLAMNGSSIVSPSVMEHAVDGDYAKAWLTQHEIGSGPYKLSRWSMGQLVELTANEGYWDGKPALDKVVIQYVKESSTQRMLLSSGEIDIAESLSLQDLNAVRQESGIDVLSFPGYHMKELLINTAKAPFDNVDVRRAVAYAVNYDNIVEHIMENTATRARGTIPKGMLGYSESLYQYPHDPDRARSLLEKAGYPNGFEATLKITNYPMWDSMAASIQADLAEVGIGVSIEQYALPTYYAMQGEGNTELSLEGWTPDYNDPLSLFWYWYYSASISPGCCNYSFYDNIVIDKLLEQAQVTADQNVRAALYHQVAAIVASDVPRIFLFQRNYLLAMRTWVKGYEYNPMMEYIFDFASLSKQ